MSVPTYPTFSANCDYPEFNGGKKVIEQLTARVRELEEIEQTNDTLLDQLGDKNAVLLDEVASQKHCYAEAVAHYEKQLAASQAYAEQLREALEKTRGALAYVKANGRDNPNLMESTAWHGLAAADKALAIPHDTSALDAYVAEKVKEAMK